MYGHGLLSFLLFILINSAIAQALTLTFPQSSLPQGQSVTVHWRLDGTRHWLFQIRLREIEPTSGIVDEQTVANDLLSGDVTFNTGILEPGEYIAEAWPDDSDPASLASSSTLTIVGSSPSVTAGPTSETSNGPIRSTTTTTSSSVSNPNSKSTSVSGSTSSPASSTHTIGSSATTTNTTKPAIFPTSPSLSDQPQSSSSSSLDSDPTDTPVPVPSPSKRFNALPVVLAVVFGLVIVGIIVLIMRRRHRRRSSLNTTPEPDSSSGNVAGNRTSQSLPVSEWQPDEKVPLSLLTDALVTPAASGASSTSHLKPSSDCHEMLPEETSAANAISPVATTLSPVLSSPTSFIPSAAAHERLLEEVQWWRTQFASSWDARRAGDDTDGAGAPPRYPEPMAGTV